MGKNKLAKFAEMKTFKCVFEPPIDAVKENSFALKGRWSEDYFKNKSPITLELGCGKGEYSVNLAKKYPKRNFIGVDIKGARMWQGAKIVEQEQLHNAAFLRTKVDFIHHFFDAGEVDEIWLTFSDPQPKKPNKRLTAKPFIDRYKKILKKDGVIHVKTDSELLYEFTLDEIENHGYTKIDERPDVYQNLKPEADPEFQEILSIPTHYEQLFSARGHTISYCAFKP